MKFLTFLTLLFLSLNAITITGIGYADDRKESTKEALADLSGKISVEVKSHFKTIVEVIGKDFQKHKEKLIDTSSNLPIKGAEFVYFDGMRLTKATAKLDSKTALKLYINELKKLQKNIAFLNSKLQTTKDKNIKYDLLNLLLKEIDSFNRHKIVAILLGGENLPTLEMTKSQVAFELQQLQHKIPTLNIASIVLTKNIKDKNKIYISPIKPSGSSEVTQLSKLLKDEMSSRLKTVKYPDQASYILKGNYEILKDSIFITINLFDTNNIIIQTNTATLSSQAYQNTSYKPKTKTFDESLNSGFVKSGKLYVNIGFRGYSRVNGIDLKKGDSVDIVVKTNKPICYYLIGYTLKQNNKFAYLLPIGSDNSPFINYITGDDVNKNITIADNVPVEAPFGRETLQIFSSTLNKNGTCSLAPPKCKYDQNDYCVINETPSKVVSNTRGLNIKHKKIKIERAENSVSWNSFEK